MVSPVRSIRISDDLWDRVDAVATEFDLTKSSVVIRALEYLLQKVEDN